MVSKEKRIDSMEETKISVIIPVYNVAGYLKRCLDSVINCTYYNLEIICVDDGSTDGSGKLLDEIAQSEERMIVVHQRNAGVSAARNIGTALATGAFVAYIDADDWVHPEYFSLMLLAQEQYNADCVICGVEIVQAQCPFINYPTDSFTLITDRITGAMENKFVRTNIWGRIYSRALLEGMQFPEDIQIAEDTIFNMNALCRRENVKVVCISERLYFYFQRQDSAVHSLPTHIVGQAIPYYAKLYETLKESNSNHRVFVLQNLLKTTLAYRYLSKFQQNYREIKTECKNIFQMCAKDINCLSLKKRLIFSVFITIPPLYRMYRIADDRTLLLWEKNQKNKERDAES